VVPDLDAGAREARTWRAATVTREQIDEVLGDQLMRAARVDWDPQQAAVVAVEETRFRALVLDSRILHRPPPDAISEAMCQGVRTLGLDALPWSDDTRDFTARVESLRHWQPDAGWPEMSDAALLRDLDEWLKPFLPGIRRRDQLSRLDLSGALHAHLPASLAGRIDEGAPRRLPVPGGSRIRLQYRPGETPVLAVKLQEMFGCTQTPTVCWGKVAVQVHLLSPAGRPLHVTQDLASFWANGYPQVRKEMRGRYPKHPWPDDPLNATPTGRTLRRR
jgi:ATP-dependent helicase HrpB